MDEEILAWAKSNNITLEVYDSFIKKGKYSTREYATITMEHVTLTILNEIKELVNAIHVQIMAINVNKLFILIMREV